MLRLLFVDYYFILTFCFTRFPHQVCLFQFSFLLFEMFSLFKSQCFNLFKYYARGNDFSKYVSTGINMLIKASSDFKY